MKTITLLCLISITSGHLLAMAGPGAPDTIHKLFHEEFPTIENPLFYREADTFGVFFKTGINSSERVFYNLDGEMIKTVKYYTENKLEPFIYERVKRKYKGKAIFGITEIETTSEHFYEIILQGDNRWWVIKSDAMGFMQIERRWRGNADNTAVN
jgi:hypothetical protein